MNLENALIIEDIGDVLCWPKIFRIPSEMTGKALADWIDPLMLACITGPPAERDVDGNIVRPLNGELGDIGLAWWDNEIPLDIIPPGVVG